MKNKVIYCYFCGNKITDCEEDVEYTFEMKSYFHLSCLEDATKNIMPSTKGEYGNRETILIMNEMNEKGYEIEIGEESEEE
jgi:hypothetical protein